MKTDTVLIGWDAIESYMRQHRTTLVRKRYPVNKDSGGSVWANKEEMDNHRVSISVQMRANVSICEQHP